MRALALACLAAVPVLSPVRAADAPPAPARVVSMNLCTDQLALLIAGPGQLVSVSYLAHDPRASAMAVEAAAIPANRGLAEDILRLAPDLVLAGSFSATATVDMLRRTGMPVEVFPPESDFDDIRTNLRRMGHALGREAQAEALVARFDADLAALSRPAGAGGRAAIYEANGYSAGRATLAGSIVAAAGLDNVAGDLGLPHGGMLSLEELVMAAPDLLVLSRQDRGTSRAEEVLDHPALRMLAARGPVAPVTDADWVCGTPHVLRAVATLRAALETAP
ncbi:MAG: ABC transporter substrate-binding protein [Paracoccus sp. (in: a-proteobacteria)]